MPLPPEQSLSLPTTAVTAIRTFVSIFLPEFIDVPFYSTKLCWYTDSLDNSFLVNHPLKHMSEYYAKIIDWLCTGIRWEVRFCLHWWQWTWRKVYASLRRGMSYNINIPIYHQSKYLLKYVISQHAADIFIKGERSVSYMRHFWCWRDQEPRRNGLEEGPNGPRNISRGKKEALGLR